MVAATPVLVLMMLSADPGPGEAAAALAQPPPVEAPATPAVTAPAAPPIEPAIVPAPPAASPPAPGEIVVTARQGPPPGDPAAKVNEASFKAVQAVDDAVIAPVAMGYQKVLPKPARRGIRNVLRNLTEPVVFVNYLLQLKPGKAAETLGRFALNSTIGLAGIIDVAEKKPFHLPYRVNGFGYTLGYYGIGPGPYLYLPLIGPTTLRDVTGRILDLSLVPGVAGKPFNTPYYSTTNGVLKSLDDRVEMDELFRKFREECPDAYTAEREWYLATRKAQIEALHGRGNGTPDLPECLVPTPMPPPVPVAAPAPAQPQPQPQSQPAVTPTM